MELITKKAYRCKNKKEIKKLYFDAFPKNERMPFFLMILMSFLWNTNFYAFYDKDRLVGIIYLATLGRQTFIMFFAVDEKLRSLGYGSQILSIVSDKYKKNKIIVSIEPCINNELLEINQKRKKFYQKNQFVETNYMIRLSGINQEILIRNGQFSKTKFFLFFMFYSCFAVIPKIWLKE